MRKRNLAEITLISLTLYRTCQEVMMISNILNSCWRKSLINRVVDQRSTSKFTRISKAHKKSPWFNRRLWRKRKVKNESRKHSISSRTNLKSSSRLIIPRRWQIWESIVQPVSPEKVFLADSFLTVEAVKLPRMQVEAILVLILIEDWQRGTANQPLILT